MTPSELFAPGLRFSVSLASLFLAFTLTSTAQPVPSFRSVPFGTSQRDAMSGLKFKDGDCSVVAIGGSLCEPIAPSLRIGTVPTNEKYRFDDDAQFVGVVVGFAAGNYDFMKDVFIVKYGQPTTIVTSQVSTKGGTQLENELVTWKTGDLVVKMVRYAASSEVSQATIETSKWASAVETRLLDMKKAAASEF
jgi:hypothetical protein